ncbi:MAG: hypothetical protein A2X86_02050 [Bdellovibrionales bacterium GWA2_49_15]|nr:MAG: hypothetical protein A2X86_02050 [Bdellovibrionales bacterium GWA2_49_15]
MSISTVIITNVLAALMSFHSGWVTRSHTTHDYLGGNGDGHGQGVSTERIGGQDYRVLFHDRGEGRIARLWMTTAKEKIDTQYQELWVELDGITVFKGRPRDFFEGRGPWKAPLVLDWQQSSGAFTSYVPFAWSKEAKIRFKGDPNYYQITYREGAGSSTGPSAEELAQFMSEDWTRNLPENAERASVSLGKPLILATGPTTVARLHLQLPHESLPQLQIRIGNQAPVPATFFFGLSGEWVDFKSATHFANTAGHLATRLPIPLAEGETLTLETQTPDLVVEGIMAATELAAARPGVHLMAQYRDQKAPGTDTTMAVFESNQALNFVALFENLTDGQRGSRLFLEGDEMIRTDGMRYPLNLGTGTEDYYNGGWYFLGPHANAFAGQHGFIVHDPEDGWRHAIYEHQLYRLHIADPIVSRGGMRFGFESGETGSFAPLRVRSLGLAYTFDDYQPQGTPQRFTFSDSKNIQATLDAERESKPENFSVREGRGVTHITAVCPDQASSVILTRTYSAAKGGQFARLRIEGREGGVWFEAYANSMRSIAQDLQSFELEPNDCQDGKIILEIDSRESPVPFSESAYQVSFLSGPPRPVLSQGPQSQILNVRDLPSGAHYVNDHTIIQDREGLFHLFGIFHHEPFTPMEERDFVHATTAENESALGPYQNPHVSMQALPGEAQIWAPHILKDEHRYVMAFRASGPDNDRSKILFATSPDLEKWTRLPGGFEDLCVARDPMLFRLGTLWVVYYTRCVSKENRASGVAYRVSSDLIHWSAPAMALALGPETRAFNSAYSESPFVFERGGWFYLSITPYPISWDASLVYRSRSPFHFEPNAIGRLRTHAPEWFAENGDFEMGKLFFTHAGAGQGGVWASLLQGL